MARERNLRFLVEAEQSIRETVRAREAFHASGMPEFAAFIGETHPNCEVTLSEGDLNTHPCIEIKGPVGGWRYTRSNWSDLPQFRAQQEMIRVIFTDTNVRVIGDNVVFFKRRENGEVISSPKGIGSAVTRKIGDKSIFSDVVEAIDWRNVFDPDFGPDSEPVDLSRIRARVEELESL